jgi:hypothetical protein
MGRLLVGQALTLTLVFFANHSFSQVSTPSAAKPRPHPAHGGMWLFHKLCSTSAHTAPMPRARQMTNNG